MDEDKKILHFSFGPVQGFVSQARRTRDLWAGSYLLSYLAGQAVQAVIDKGGSIVMPEVGQDPIRRAIDGKITPDYNRSRRAAEYLAATTGSLPNRFKATVPAQLDGGVCETAVKEAWEKIAEAVRDKYDSTKQIADALWNRQIQGAWDCTWAIGDGDHLLDLRKNMRRHIPPPEAGEKCTVCGERQEVSGKGMGTSASRKEMREWWTRFRDNAEITPLDLRDGERLCAVCLTKRLFPRVAREATHQGKAKGWEVPKGFPSTAYMAAADWIIRVLEECADATNGQKVRDAVEAFLTAAETAGVDRSEANTRIKGISDRLSGSRLKRDDYWFADIDGSAFFEDFLRNEDEFPIKDDAKKAKRDDLVKALKALQEALPEKSGQPRKATPFYALLLMDGDGMGKLLSAHPGKQAEISQALAGFSSRVPDIVYEHDGRLIYAGGDDVFALLPLDKAISCAAACREAYQRAFQEKASFVPESGRTISAAIVYAHIHTALGVAVRDAHRLLDEVAKDRTGRDAIACRVWKRGGPVLTWAQPWKVALDVKDGKGGTLVDEVKRCFQDGGGPAQFSSKFFYKVRDLFDLLKPHGGPVLTDAQRRGLLVAEYLSTRNLVWPSDPATRKPPTEDKKRQIAGERVERLLALCQQATRKVEETTGAESFDSNGRVRADGALLVRFLAQKEV
jgi:CRISPR-associated protein Cmr2